MRIGVDIRGILTGGISGVEQYTIEILKSLISIDPNNTYVLFYFSYKDLDQKLNDLLAKYPEFRRPNVQIKKSAWPNLPLLLHAVLKPLNWPHADKLAGGIDVMFMPSPRLLPLSKRCAKVTTFHDLIFMIHPEFFTLSSRLWQWQMSYAYEARTSDRIIAVSKNTKRDLINLISADPGKTHVVYEGIHPQFFEDYSHLYENLKTKFNLPEKFIYFVGSVEPRKNLITLIRALHHLQQESANNNLKLVVSGGKSWLSSELYDEIKKLNLTDDIIFTGYVTEEEKIAFFQMAHMFVFPSIYEGFGMMLFEAFACDCPVIVSDNSSLPEVGGDAVMKFSTFDYKELAEKIKELDSNSELRANLIKKGKARVQQYSWDKAARNTLEILHQAYVSHEK